MALFKLSHDDVTYAQHVRGNSFIWKEEAYSIYRGLKEKESLDNELTQKAYRLWKTVDDNYSTISKIEQGFTIDAVVSSANFSNIIASQQRAFDAHNELRAMATAHHIPIGPAPILVARQATPTKVGLEQQDATGSSQQSLHDDQLAPSPAVSISDSESVNHPQPALAAQAHHELTGNSSLAESSKAGSSDTDLDHPHALPNAVVAPIVQVAAPLPVGHFGPLAPIPQDASVDSGNNSAPPAPKSQVVPSASVDHDNMPPPLAHRSPVAPIPSIDIKSPHHKLISPTGVDELSAKAPHQKFTSSTAPHSPVSAQRAIKLSTLIVRMNAEGSAESVEGKLRALNELLQFMKTVTFDKEAKMSSESEAHFLTLVKHYRDVLDISCLSAKNGSTKSKTKPASWSQREVNEFQNQLLLKKANLLLERDKKWVEVDRVTETLTKLRAEQDSTRSEIDATQQTIQDAERHHEELNRRLEAAPDGADAPRLKQELARTARIYEEEKKKNQNLTLKHDSITHSLDKIVDSCLEDASAEVIAAAQRIEAVKASSDSIDYTALEGAVQRYEEEAAQFKARINAYNASKSNLVKITPEPVRELSKHQSQVFNSVVKEGGVPSICGYVYKVVTDKNLIDEIRKPAPVNDNSIRISPKRKGTHTELHHETLGQNELQVAVQSYVKGEKPGPAESMLIRDPQTNEVAIKSKNLSKEQLRREAIEAAELYLLHYKGSGDIMIMGDDPVKSQMVQAAIYALAPDMPMERVKNFVSAPNFDQYKHTFFFTFSSTIKEKFIEDMFDKGFNKILEAYRRETAENHVTPSKSTHTTHAT